jgi:hypothetical protein
MKLIRNQQCRCCKELFSPNYRSAKRQMYCGKPKCRKASKTASQKRWTKITYKGSDNVERVREWRRANPERQRRTGSGPVLQDICNRIDNVKQDVIPLLASELPALPPVLQDFCIAQHPVFVGLIAHITGCVLQDDIAVVSRH